MCISMIKVDAQNLPFCVQALVETQKDGNILTDNRRESVRDVLRQITTVFVPGPRLAEAGHTAQREPVGVVGGGRQGGKVFCVKGSSQ